MKGASDDHHARRHRRLQRTGRRDLRGRPCHHARHHLVGRQAQPQRDRLLHRRARRGRRLQRHRHRGRLPVGLDLPGLRGPHVPLRLRRLDHRAGSDALVPAGPLPAGRPDAQRRQVHRGRRAQLPPAQAPGADRRGHQHAAHLRHLPHRPARGRGLADRGPGRHQLHAGRPHLRDLHGRLRRLRRHARHDVGADHQGRHAHDRRRRHQRRGAGEVQLQPVRAAQQGGGRAPQGQGDPGPRHLPDHAGARHLHGADDLHRHGRPAAHPHALLHGARLEGRARRRSCGRSASSPSSPRS